VAVAGVVGGVSSKVSGVLNGAANGRVRAAGGTVYRDAKTGLETAGTTWNFGGSSNQAVSGAASALAGAAARTLMNGGDFGDNLQAVLPEVIAYTIGNAVAGEVKSQTAEARRDELKDLSLDLEEALSEIQAASAAQLAARQDTTAILTDDLLDSTYQVAGLKAQGRGQLARDRKGMEGTPAARPPQGGTATVSKDGHVVVWTREDGAVWSFESDSRRVDQVMGIDDKGYFVYNPASESQNHTDGLTWGELEALYRKQIRPAEPILGQDAVSSKGAAGDFFEGIGKGVSDAYNGFMNGYIDLASGVSPGLGEMAGVGVGMFEAIVGGVGKFAWGTAEGIASLGSAVADNSIGWGFDAMRAAGVPGLEGGPSGVRYTKGVIDGIGTLARWDMRLKGIGTQYVLSVSQDPSRVGRDIDGLYNRGWSAIDGYRAHLDQVNRAAGGGGRGLRATTREVATPVVEGGVTVASFAYGAGEARAYALARRGAKALGTAEGAAPVAYGTPYRQLSSKARAALLGKVEARTITREEWNRLRWNDRLTARRQEGGGCLP
jgi:hypothetical protein